MCMAKDEARWAYWTQQIKGWQARGLSRNEYCQHEGSKLSILLIRVRNVPN